MARTQLTVDDLVGGLAAAPAAYHALCVFADDVAEACPTRGQSRLSHSLESGGKTYYLGVSPGSGVVRLSRVPDPAVEAFGALAVREAVAVAWAKKGEAVGMGDVLGLLVGGVLGSAGHGGPRQVLTVVFNPMSREWCAYDGGLVRWVKRELMLPVDVAK